MRILYRLLSFGLFIVVGVSCCAQNIKQDMLAMYNSYMSLKYFSTTVQVSIYNTANDKTPTITKKGSVKKSGNMYYTSLDDIKVLINDKYLIYVSGKDKLIYYKEHAKDTKQEFKAPFDIKEVTNMLDTALKRSDTIQYMGTVNGIKHYSIRSSHSVISTIDLYIEASSNLISKVVYYYDADVMKRNNKVAVNFSNTIYKEPFAAAEFSESVFLKKKGNAFIAADGYNGYEVYNDKSFDDGQ